MRKTLNRALLRKIATKLRRIRHEEHYDQRTLIEKTSCGTAACIAGYVALELGVKPKFEKDTGNSEWWRTDSTLKGKSVCPVDIAMTALGLNEKQANALFTPQPFFRPRYEGQEDYSPEQRWPTPFAERFQAALDKKSERPSRVAADLLDAIADGEVVL